MNYQAFTNDSLTMMYEGIRGALASDDAFSGLGEEPRFRVRETPEWKTLMSEGAFNNTFMTGEEYAKWIDTEEKRHQALMKEAGFLAGQ